MRTDIEDTLAKRSEIHLMRRFWHILVGAICLTVYYLTETTLKFWGYFSLVVACFGFLLDFTRFKNQSLNEWLTKYFGALMRKSEKLSFSGLPFYALGVGLSLFLFQKEIAILSILYLIFADPIASIVGVYMGKDRLLPNKTLQGTVAAFTTCLIIGVSYLVILQIQSPNIIIFAFFGAIAGALSELLSAFNIDDNMTIPVISGVALTLLNLWLQVF